MYEMRVIAVPVSGDNTNIRLKRQVFQKKVLKSRGW